MAMDNRRLGGRDLLSDLPLSILETILMLVPIRDAIRTSILSSKWRYRWTRLPRLVFHEHDMGSSEGSIADHLKRLKRFIHSTLFLHEGPIHKFEFAVDGLNNCSFTDQWLLFLSRRGIKELIIETDLNPTFFYLPFCLYTCQSLTLLDLRGCTFHPPPPSFKGFSHLKTLILHFVEVSSHVIESIVDSSPLLENFDGESTGEFDLRISNPNLKNIRMHGDNFGVHLYAPLLVKLDISFKDYSVEEELILLDHPVCNYMKFLGGFIDLEILIGNGYFLRFLINGIKHYRRRLLVFNRLKIITLCWVCFDDSVEIMVTVRLIMDAAASLRRLEVSVRGYCTMIDRIEAASEASVTQFWDSECLRDCTLKKLEVVEITEFRGALHEIKFIKFLLENSPVLETILIKPETFFADLQETPSSIVELWSYPRASSNAEILFNRD